MSTPDWLEPLYDAAGMGGMDRWAIEERGIPSLELMEVAGGALARETELIARSGPIRIVCGKGNNGGDGMVAARLLRAAGHDVEVLSIWPLDDLSPDSTANLERLDGPAREVGAGEWPAALRGSGAIVDAIFGTGFDGAPRDGAKAAIEAVNDAGAPVVACDVASGVDASSGEIAGVAVDADLTVTFHVPKVGHRIAPGKGHTGRLVVAPIGIPDGAPGTPVAGAIAEPVLDLPPRRGAESTKFSSGDVLVVGGSRGLTGAPSMASLAAIRAGAGYATVGCPADLEPILEVKLTEVMTIGLEQVGGGLGAAAAPILERAERSACVVLGPGLGRAEHSLRLARELAPRVPVPLLIDADGLNALGTDLELLRSREAPTVLTPHAGELGRLLGCDSTEISAHRLAKARLASAAAGAIVVLKGDDSIVADGDRIAVNALESPGLATAGTGDVLSGTIGALIARGCEPFAAACAGVYGHARAGRIAARRVGAESVIAGDVIEALPEGLAR